MALLDNALALIAKFGESYSYRQTTGATYNPATRTYSGGSTTATAILGYAEPFKQVDGVAVQIGDRKLWVAPDALTAASVTPQVGDFVEKDSTRYRVLDVQTWKIASSLGAYVFHLRGVQ